MYKKTVLFFLVTLICVMNSKITYGQVQKNVLQRHKVFILISSQDSWEKWGHYSLVSALLPKSKIGSMNIRINHKDKEEEYYGTINAGRRWDYYEVNSMGAVENGLGNILNQSGFSTAFFSDNKDLKKIIENSRGETAYTSEECNDLSSQYNQTIISNSDLILIQMDTFGTKKNEAFLLNYFEKNSVKVFLFCPYNKDSNSDLTPFLFYDSLNPKQGLITANTTRRQGIITNIDIAPEILASFDIHDSPFTSKGIDSISDNNALRTIKKELNKISYINSYRSSIIKAYIILMLIMLFLFYFINNSDYLLIKKIYTSVTWAILWLPILFMVNIYNNINQNYILAIIFFILVLVGCKVSYDEKGLMIISSIILLILTFDILLGAGLQQNSFLGYDPVIGARFYGMGNEYAGIMIGNLYLFLYCIRKSRYYIVLASILQLGLIVLLCMPFLGANVGGTISALTGMSLFWIQHYKTRENKHSYYTLIFAVIFFIIIWVVFDLFLVKEHSHFGQILIQLVRGDFHVVIQTLQRKIVMNLQLIKYSLWSKFFIASLVILGLYFNVRSNILKKVGAPFIGAMVGAILFNDSGIVMSGTCIIYFIFPYLIEYIEKSKRNIVS